MPAIALLVAASAMWQQPTLPAALPLAEAAPVRADSARPQRPHAIEYSDAYGVRLSIHHYASYATIPLFAAEFALGQSLYNNPPGSASTLQAHRIVAFGVAGLFAVNTVTGGWNLWESRRDPSGRLRRYIHSALMFASDAGFVATGVTAPGSRNFAADPSQARLHRTIAIASMGTALAGYVMMLVWKN